MGSTNGRDETGETNETALVALVEERANRSIRRVWHDGRWYFSVIDVLAVLTDSAAPRQYWVDMKRRMKNTEGWSETQAKCLPLPLKAADGKMRETDTADKETLYRIVQSVPSPRAEPLKLWLAKAGVEKEEGAAMPALPPVPPADAPAVVHAAYLQVTEHLERLAAVLAEYESRLAAMEGWRDYVEGWRIYIEAWHEVAESRFEAQDAQLDLLPDLFAQLKPETLTPAHRATVKALVSHLHDVSGLSYGALYTDLNRAFHVPTYHAIADEQYEAVCAWLEERTQQLGRMGRP